MKAFRVKDIIKSLIILIAAIGILCSLNSHIFAPFTMFIKPDMVFSVANSEDGTAIIDESQNRIIFLNKDGYVQNVRVNGYFDSETVFYRQVCAGDGCFYVAEFQNQEKNTLLSEERIVRYSLEGDRLETIWVENHDEKNDAQLECDIYALHADDKYVYVYRENEKNCHLFIQQIPVDLVQPDSEKVLESDLGILNENVFCYSLFTDFEAGYYAAIDSFGRFYEYDHENGWIVSTEEKVRSIIGDVEIWENEFICYDEDSLLEKYRCAGSLIAKIWYFWLSVLVLVAVTLVAIIRNIRSDVKAGNYSSIKLIGVILAVLAVVLIISAFFISRMNAQIRDSRIHEMSALSFVIEENKDWFSLENDHNNINPASYFHMTSTLESLSINQAKADLDTDIILVDRDDRIIADSRGFYYVGCGIGGVVFNDEDEELGITSFNYRDGWEEINGIVNRLRDDNDNYIGSIVVFSNTNNFIRSIRSTWIHMIIDLLTYLIMFVYIAMEIKSLAERRIRSAEANDENPYYVGSRLARPIAFLQVAACSADSALLVIIAKEMLIGTAQEGNATLMVIPPMAFTAGYVSGSLLYKALMQRFSVRKTLIGTTITLTALLGLCSIFVLNGNFIMLAVCLFLVSTLGQVLYMFPSSLALGAPTDDIKREINSDTYAAQISGVALSTIIAGSLAVNVGNYAVYWVGLGMSALMLIYLLVNYKALPKTLSSGGAGSTLSREGLAFIRKPQMITLLLCAAFASYFASGFIGIVFPLVADQSGLDKAMITNIQIFVKAFVFMLIPMTNGLEKKLGVKQAIIAVVLTIAGGYFALIFNLGAFFASILYGVMFLALKTILPIFAFAWQKEVEVTGADGESAQTAVTTALSSLAVVKSIVIGALLGLGIKLAGGIIGAYLVGATVLFALVKQSKRQ